MYRTVIIQLCQGKDSFPFYGTFKYFEFSKDAFKTDSKEMNNATKDFYFI